MARAYDDIPIPFFYASVEFIASEGINRRGVPLSTADTLNRKWADAFSTGRKSVAGPRKELKTSRKGCNESKRDGEIHPSAREHLDKSIQEDALARVEQMRGRRVGRRRRVSLRSIL